MRRPPGGRDEQYSSPVYLDLLGRVAANVRELRAAKGWSQEEAAHRCSEMATYVYRCIENAKTNLTATSLARIAAGYGVDVQTLFTPAAAPAPRRRGRPKKPETASPVE